MKKIAVALSCLVLCAAQANAHLCNDVFLQAKDNLAVKVDIRDNQLRVNKTAEFRVYLLNTMDRDIANIQLAVDSPDFDAVVKPASDWDSFPSLATKNNGGKKEYFIVQLTRKETTAEGKYKIGLRLFNGENEKMVFKTMDIKDALTEMHLPKKSSDLIVDGQINKSEWENGLLCASFYEYKWEPVASSLWLKKQAVNKISPVQTRCRFSHDNSNLYCMVDFQNQKRDDVANIYIAKDTETEPQVVSVNLQQQNVAIENNPQEGIQSKFNGTRAEIAIPFARLGLEGAKSFYVNITRKQDNTQTYWRGNEISVKDSIVYANFIIKD